MANRGGTPLTSRRAAVANSVVRASMRTLSSGVLERLRAQRARTIEHMVAVELVETTLANS